MSHLFLAWWHMCFSWARHVSHLFQLGETCVSALWYCVSPFSAWWDMCLTFFNSWLKHCLFKIIFVTMMQMFLNSVVYAISYIIIMSYFTRSCPNDTVSLVANRTWLCNSQTLATIWQTVHATSNYGNSCDRISRYQTETLLNSKQLLDRLSEQGQW